MLCREHITDSIKAVKRKHREEEFTEMFSNKENLNFSVYGLTRHLDQAKIARKGVRTQVLKRPLVIEKERINFD